MKEFRCQTCSSLLYKGDGNADIEIKCTKCRTMNYPARVTKDDIVLKPKGAAFIAAGGALSHRCSHCHRLQFFSRAGNGIYEMKCRYCKIITVYDTVLMRKGEFPLIKSGESKKNVKNLAY